MGIIKEFREFAVKGNVVDMAVGIVIGAAFGSIVNSFVKDIIMPPLGLIISGLDFTALKLTLKHGLTPETTVSINYGLFFQAIISFTIIAMAVFMLVKIINTLRRKQQAGAAKEEVPPTAEQKLLTEIRDALRERR